MIKVAPSVMCFDFLNLGDQIKQLDDAGADMFHIDIMDGHYVANHSLNSDVVRAFNQATDTLLDVHLMVTNPTHFINTYAEAGADIITLHIEMLGHPIRAMKEIRALGKKAGIAINPATDITSIKYMLDYIDLVCVMTIDPGFAGQAIIPSVYGKISELRSLFSENHENIDIMIDGQVKGETAADLVARGANILVVGTSGLFSHGSDKYKEMIDYYKNLDRPI